MGNGQAQFNPNHQSSFFPSPSLSLTEMKQTRASLSSELQCVSAGEAPVESPTFTLGSRAWTKIKRIIRDPRQGYKGKQARKNTDLGDDALFSLRPTQSPGTLNHSGGLSQCLLGNNFWSSSGQLK